MQSNRERLSLYVGKGSERKLVTFRGYGDGKVRLYTNDADLQKAIEGSPYYQKRKIKLESSKEVKDGSNGKGAKPFEQPKAETKVFEDVTTFEEAKNILKNEYGVAFQALGSPEKILAKAAENGVSFPNLKAEE